MAPPPHLQGDAAILRYLDKLPEQIDISDTPDLLPPLALYAALRPGRDTRFTHAAFLRRKESDRLTAVSAVLNALGASAEVQPDGLIIHGVSALHGGGRLCLRRPPHRPAGWLRRYGGRRPRDTVRR